MIFVFNGFLKVINMSEASVRKKSRRQPRQQEDKATLKKILAQELATLAREANSDFLAKETGERGLGVVTSVREGLLARLAADFESAQKKEVLARFFSQTGGIAVTPRRSDHSFLCSGLSELELVLVTSDLSTQLR